MSLNCRMWAVLVLVLAVVGGGRGELTKIVEDQWKVLLDGEWMVEL